MKQSPRKSQSKLEKTTLLLQYFCYLKNFFRLHFSTIQAKIHIQSHSIFIYLNFVRAHMAFLLCFFSQEASAYHSHPTHHSHCTDGKRKKVQILTTLYPSKASKKLLPGYYILFRSQITRCQLSFRFIAQPWGRHNSSSQTCTNNGTTAPSLLLHQVEQALDLSPALTTFYTTKEAEYTYLRPENWNYWHHVDLKLSSH